MDAATIVTMLGVLIALYAISVIATNGKHDNGN